MYTTSTTIPTLQRRLSSLGLRKTVYMCSASDASLCSSKWASRASSNPFNASSVAATCVENGLETTGQCTTQDADGKENCSPSSGCNLDHECVTGRLKTRPSLVKDNPFPFSLSAGTLTPSLLLGKRLSRADVCSPATHKALDMSEEDQETNLNHLKRYRRDSFTVANVRTHEETRALELDDVILDVLEDQEQNEVVGCDTMTMFVDDLDHVGQLHFGAVALGERKTRRLTLKNASESSSARVKYEGCALVHEEHGPLTTSGARTKTRFKCDLHLGVIDALKSVTLRVTFEPLPADVERQVAAMLKFTVNDKFTLQCRLVGTVTPRVVQLSRMKRMRQSNQVDAGMVQASLKHIPSSRISARQMTSRTLSKPRHQPLLTSSVLIPSDLEPELEPVDRTETRVGDKRPRSSCAIEFSPLRYGLRRTESETHVRIHETLKPRKSSGASQDHTPTKKPCVGSWWKQRQETHDDKWMGKQTEGFTKWMNYVLLGSTALRLSGCDGQDGVVGSVAGTSRRFDYLSLRELAQKRMESSWVQSAATLYHSHSMDDILFNLQDEIGNQRLCLRADRPVYADVGLQEDLISLLNNYHPVWLCLGLYAVLGDEVMTQEKCSLRTIFRCIFAKANKLGVNSLSDRKMPRVLRRIILKHLVKDSHVAQSYRLVNNLLTPLDGSTADRHDGGNVFKSTKKTINGREYFDSLMQAFILKFFMLVIFLDRAIVHREDKFAHFPCLFRATRRTSSTVSANAADSVNNKKLNGDDGLCVKKSKVFVTEFCKLFLASEGRIDKHLKQLGYILKYEQTPLDEMDLEITNLEIDLCDGVRLAKLMEALTAPSSSMTCQTQPTTFKPKSLSSFLRVPALSRLQKVHNVEICLHFLQDKCGASILDNLKSSSGRGDKHPPAGRVRMSTSGFAGLRTEVDAKMVEMLAKDIVRGHREKTLALLWIIISQFQLQSLVDAQTMRQEIVNVVKRLSLRAKEFYDLQQRKVPLVFIGEHECYGLLLEWCRAVCANYDVGVNDFSRSFADGKALCYLLHYYHPMLLSNSDMLPTTSDICGEDDHELSKKALLNNEQRHFALINDRIKQLGEVPVLMPQQYNTNNPPEEKVVVTFVCYLQSRLMDSYSEIHAAFSLKRWWKSPMVRLRMLRKKNISARIVQRFWYSSSQKRLAIRQCRKLLRAGHFVKSIVLSWVARRHFLRLRKAVSTMQTAFRTRRHVRVNKDLLGAARIIQSHCRKHLKRRHTNEIQIQLAVHRKVAERVLARVSCGVIERNWLQHLSRKGARLVRQQMVADRHAAVSHIQATWRRGCVRVVARTRRAQAWRREHHAAQVIQVAWSIYQRHLEASKRILALYRFEQLMKNEAFQKKQMKLKCKVETRAAIDIQRCFRKVVFRKQEIAATKIASAFRGEQQRLHFQMKKHATVVLQRNIRVWRRRRQLCALMDFHNMLKIYLRNKANAAGQRLLQLKLKADTEAAYRIQRVYRSFRSQKQTFAATRIQSVVLAWTARKWYFNLRQSACLIQKNVRTWRRQKQLRALLTFGDLLLRYRRMEQDRKERIRQDRLRRLQKCVARCAAYRIQSIYRSYAYHKRMLAATLIQAVFRGCKGQQQYAKKRASVVVMQHWFRSWLVVSTFRRAMYQHRASVSIQKFMRGWISRRRFSFYTLQTQLKRMRVLMSCWQIECWYIDRMMKYHKKRTLVMRSHWMRLCTGIVQKFSADANKIAMCWRSFCFRRHIDAHIQRRRQMDDAAQRLQVWWLELCCKWIERQRIDEMKRRCEMEAIAVAMAKTHARRVLALWLYKIVIMPVRERNFRFVVAQKLQAWWRGTFVRLYHSTPEIICQRKRLSAMKLVWQQQHAGMDTSATNLQQVSVKSNEETNVLSEQPQTLGARLDMALHMLLHGKRLQDMLFASHTVEVCTRYSRECCRKCVQLQISSTIFAAVRGLNRSRPHVELLHQLLLVLKNLTVYRRSADKNAPMWVFASDDAKGRLDVDLRALDTLVDLLHIHRDMHHIVVLSADVITYYVESLKPLVGSNAGVRDSWSEAEKRLGRLQELLARKLALYNATASFRRMNDIPDTSSTSNLMQKLNPKTAVSIMEKLVVLLERQGTERSRCLQANDLIIATRTS